MQSKMLTDTSPPSSYSISDLGTETLTRPLLLTKANDNSAASFGSQLSAVTDGEISQSASSAALIDPDRSSDSSVQPSPCSSSSSATTASIVVVDIHAPRAQWDNKAQFVLSLISYAVGLGNIWRFPYLCQKNGGGAFLIPFTISLITLGIPLFYLELGIGQKFRTGPIGAWNSIHPYLGGLGISSAVISFLIGLYYNVIIAWCLFYLVHSFQGPLPWTHCPTGSADTGKELECQLSSETSYFWYREAVQLTDSIDDFGGLNWQMSISLIVCWTVVYLCVMKGIKSSGKVMCFTAVFPYVVLTIFFVRALMLDGAMIGVSYLFTPNFAKLKEPGVWLEGATQVCFSFGLAFGGLIAFSSYNHPKNDCRRDTIIVSISNWMTALYGAVVIFAVIGFKATMNHSKCMNRNLEALGAEYPNLLNMSRPVVVDAGASDVYAYFGLNFTSTIALDECDIQKELSQAAGGTGLAFITFTEAIVKFPGSPFWAVLFFLMLLSLGLGSMFGTLEGVITSFIDMRVTKSLRKELITGVLCLVSLGIGFLFVTRAGQYWVQLFDTYAGSFAIMAVVLLEVIAVSYVYGWQRFCDDLKDMTGHYPSLYWRLSWRFFAPLLMLVIFVSSVVANFLKQPEYEAYNRLTAITEKKPLPPVAITVAIIIVAATILPIPCVTIFRLVSRYISIHERRRNRSKWWQMNGNQPFRAPPVITIITGSVSEVNISGLDSGRGSLEDNTAKTPSPVGLSD